MSKRFHSRDCIGATRLTVVPFFGVETIFISPFTERSLSLMLKSPMPLFDFLLFFDGVKPFPSS